MATPVNAAALLDLAEKVLDRKQHVPGERAVRAAVVLGRQALEAQVDRLYLGVEQGVGWPTMRSKLVIIRECVDRDMGERAQAAWDGLSYASHQHAYEFQPSTPEVRELLRLVASLLPTTSTTEAAAGPLAETD